MKAWLNRNQFEAYIDKVAVSGDKVTYEMHSHLDGSKTENGQLLLTVDMEKHKVLVTLAEYIQIKGLGESKSNIELPPDKGGSDVSPVKLPETEEIKK